MNLTRRNALKLTSSIGIATLLPKAAWALQGNPMDEFFQLDSIAQAALVKKGDVSQLELAQAAIKRIEALNPKLNAVITPIFENALEAAKQGLPEGPFTGVPFLFKDLMDYKGYRTTYGSQATFGHISDHTHIFGRKDLAAGLNVLGKTNTPELGLLATTEPVAFGPSRNPWDLSRSSGGSSGGAGAAVASGMVSSAQGSDGGGSLRIPASCNGIFALKPSRGREVNDKVSEPWHISVKGYLTRSVRDSAALFALTERQGPDAAFAPVGIVSTRMQRKLKIGLIMNGINGNKPEADVEAEILRTAKLCESLGHEVVETRFPIEQKALLDGFLAVWSSYAAGFKSSLEKQTGQAVGDEILEPWTLYMASYYQQKGAAHMDAAKIQFAEITARLDRMMDQFDVLLSPVLASVAPKLGLQAPTVPALQLQKTSFDYVNYTPVYNISGQPAMSVPLGSNAQGLPIGSQFAARQGDEKTLFELAYQLEQARSWQQRWAVVSAANVG